MNPYAAAAHAIANPHELVSGAEFRRMLIALLSAPVDFPTDDAAEDYVRKNAYGVGRVLERGVHVQTYYGERVKV